MLRAVGHWAPMYIHSHTIAPPVHRFRVVVSGGHKHFAGGVPPVATVMQISHVTLVVAGGLGMIWTSEVQMPRPPATTDLPGQLRC